LANVSGQPGCKADADCCKPATCWLGKCVSQCSTGGVACDSSSSKRCCSGLFCAGGSCSTTCGGADVKCDFDSDCCSKKCVNLTRAGGPVVLLCSAPQPRAIGEACTSSYDCQGATATTNPPVACVDGTCSDCHAPTKSCTDYRDCCGKYECLSG